MKNRIIARAAQSIFTIIVVISLTFVLIRFLPGGPMQYLRAQMMQQHSGQSVEQINRLVQVYTNVNPSKPLYIQYFSYVDSILHLDLGKSIWYGKPVSSILLGALPWTLLVMLISTVLIFSIGVLIGAVMAYLEGGRLDLATSMVSIFLTLIPYYVAAVILLYILSYQEGWFPTGGRYGSVAVSLSMPFLISVAKHACLPILSVVVTGFGLQALAMRGNSIQVLGEDFLHVARLRGVPDSRIAIRYVGHNAILPMYTGLMISIGFLFGGSVILEQIFSYPGVGYYMFKAISARDYPLMMGAFLVITCAVVIAIFIADMTYGFIDPRIGGENREAY